MPDKPKGTGWLVILGAIIGAGIALLFSPKAGHEMRHLLLSQSRNFVKKQATSHQKNKPGNIKPD